MNTSSRYLQYFAAVFIYVQLVNGLAPRRAPSSVTPRTRPLKSSENVTEVLEGDCPESDGFFADAQQCDKYYECRDGKVVAERLCADGMVFNDFSPQHEKCDLPFNIDCSQRPKLQEPKPTIHCPRLNGYFNHEDPNTCNKFYYCVDGKFNLITCPDGLVYSEKTGICSWPDEAKKKGCSSQELFKFSCPKVDSSVAAQHPRYPDPEDCQYFYVCINGEVPRRSGCKMGQVFNDATDSCDWPRNVPDCAEWYKGVLTEEELEALEHPTPKPKPKQPSQAVKRQKTKATDFARLLDTTQIPQ
ncbi:protein obstructor-E-like [Planococcus citri]|uniref:protein obstructor-E-like n=1 Tax=Planococcus citri TaxID=170843 RepID=UPI0031F9547C